MKNKKPIHFTQLFGIKAKESELDFFDVNLRHDSRIFIDPFLIKRSPYKKEKELYLRFDKYFRIAFRKSLNPDYLEKIDDLNIFLSFKEPKELCLGYTCGSNEGSGLSGKFASSLFSLFLNKTYTRVILKKDFYKKGRIDPEIFAIFGDDVADDGISDLAGNLIMSYLVSYTKEQCKKWKIKLSKQVTVGQSFDFDDEEWTNGFTDFLPENPYKPGEAIILVPKRFLRANMRLGADRIKRRLVGILSRDPSLKMKFSGLISKSLKQIKVSELRYALMNNQCALKKYIEMNEKRNTRPYDFITDKKGFLSYKYSEYIFKDFIYPTNPSNPIQLLNIVKEFVDAFQKYYEDGGSNRLWQKDDKNTKRQPTEIDLGMCFRGAGYFFFQRLKEVKFDPEVKTNSGVVDFRIIYKDFCIVIEFKRLENSSNKGVPPIPSYLHGIQRQLPIYANSHNAQYAFYITGQCSDKYNKRVEEIHSLVPDIEKKMLNKNQNFVKLFYKNIDFTEKPSASNT